MKTKRQKKFMQSISEIECHIKVLKGMCPVGSESAVLLRRREADNQQPRTEGEAEAAAHVAAMEAEDMLAQSIAKFKEAALLYREIYGPLREAPKDKFPMLIAAVAYDDRAFEAEKVLSESRKVSEASGRRNDQR